MIVSMYHSYYHTIKVVFVYNASSEESLGSLEKWYRELEKYACKDVSGIKGVVLANKVHGAISPV